MKEYLFKSWTSLFIWLLGTLSPVQANRESLPPAVSAPVAVTQSVKPSVPSETFIRTAPLAESARSYTYVFSGKAVSEGQPCSNARVEVRLISSTGAQIRNVMTGEDGAYQTAIDVVGEPNQSVNWEVSALSPDLLRVNLEGHQILMDEPSIQMDVPLQFAEI